MGLKGKSRQILAGCIVFLVIASIFLVANDGNENLCFSKETVWVLSLINLMMISLALVIIGVYNKVLNSDELLYLMLYFIFIFLEIVLKNIVVTFINTNFLPTVFLGGIFLRGCLLSLFLFRKSSFMKKVDKNKLSRIFLVSIMFLVSLIIGLNNEYLRDFKYIQVTSFNIMFTRVFMIILILGVLYNCKKNYEENDIEGFIITIMIIFLIKGMGHKLSKLIFITANYTPLDLVRGELTFFLGVVMLLISLAVILIKTYKNEIAAENKYKLFYNVVDRAYGSKVIIYKNKEIFYLNKNAKKFFYNDKDYDGDFSGVYSTLNFSTDKKEQIYLLDKIKRKEPTSITITDKSNNHHNVNYQFLEISLDEKKLKMDRYDIFSISNVTNENLVQREQKKFRTVNNNIEEIIFMVDSKYKISYVNRKCEKAIGLGQHNIIGKHLNDFLKCDFLELETNRTGIIESTFGAKLEVTYKTETLTDDNNDIIGHAIICSKNARNEELRVLNERVKKAEDIVFKRATFTSLAHELRTPIHIIYSSLQLLGANKEKEDFVDNFDKYEKTMKLNSLRLLKLINDIIDINKIDIGSLGIKSELYNVVNLVENICDSTLPYMKSKDINLIFDTTEEERYIMCDKDMMERILLNLISNAIKFTPNYGDIYVTLSFDKEWVYISVKDTGIGIAKEMSELVFERFKQCDNGEITKKGSGIGLSLVKTLVELQSGTIKLESDTGKGCDFIIALPNSSDEDNINAIISGVNREVSLLGDISVEFSDIEL